MQTQEETTMSAAAMTPGQNCEANAESFGRLNPAV